MRRFLISAAVLVALTAVPVQAGGGKFGGGPHIGIGPGNGPHINSAPKPAMIGSGPKLQAHCAPNYHLQCGVKCSFGYCYKGCDHCHWSYQCYSPQYCCTIFYDPCTCCYYYWCVRDCCYYPVSYCPYGSYH